jgi:UDP-N-acetylmuramate dehydrogenase
MLHFGDGFAEVTPPVPLPDGRYAITAQAGAPLAKLSAAAADAALSGLEFAAGIPGTVGGGVLMNAGAFGGELKNVVEGVTCATMTGEIRHYTNEEMAFDYRRCRLSGPGAEPEAVVSATFALIPGDGDTIRVAMREFGARRREKQPLTLPCCGSTFKRPPGRFAGTLIDQCGLKGLRVGGASVSTKHAGFLVNDGGGTAADYLRLIAEVRRVVEEKTGVLLEPEVRVVGVDAPPAQA